MKVFSVITIFFLGLYLQGCAPRLDYNGQAMMKRTREKGTYNDVYLETLETVGPAVIADISPVASTIDEMQLVWFPSYVTYVPKTVIYGNGFSINLWPHCIIVNENRQYVTDITQSQHERIWSVLLDCVTSIHLETPTPTPATSPAIREGQ